MEIIFPLNISSGDLEELQKVFSIICSAQVPENSLLDKQSLNKKGIFSSTNMVGFIQTLLKNPLINTEDIANIIQLFSAKSTQEYGLVTWNAFVQTMNDWITNVSCFSDLWKKKGIVLGPLERNLFHCTIRNFFLRKASSSKTENQLNYANGQNGTRFDHDIISVEEKLGSQVLFEEISKLLQNFDQLSIKIMQENPLQNMNAIFKLAISKANSPLDIYRNSELISRTINLILESGMLKEALIIIMKDEDPLGLKSEALQILSYVLYCCKLNNEYINGSLILRDPQVKDGLFHPDFHLAFLTVLLNLARYSNDFEAQQQSLICLGFITQVNEGSMNYILMEMVHNFSLYSSGELPERYLEALAFIVQSTVHSICNNSIHISDETLFALIEVGSKLLELRDLFSLLDTGFEVLAYTLPRVELTVERPFLYNTLKRIMDLLTLHNSLVVKISAMMTLKAIIEGNETQTEALLNANLLLVLSQIMTSNEESLKPLCCRILRILFRKSYVLQSTELNNLYTAIHVIRDVYSIPYCHWEAIRMMKEIIELGESYAFSLIKAGAVRMIIVNLHKFEEQDEVLREIYNFKGCYSNVPYLLDCLNILDVILSGRGITKFGSVLEILANQLDKEVVTSLLSIVEIFIKEQDEFISQCSRSYMKIYTDIEPKELLVNIIGHIVKIHEKNQLENSKAVLLQIKNYLSAFPIQESTEEISDDFVLVIRFFTSAELDMGECRVIRLGSSSSLSELHQAILNEQGYKGLLTCKILEKDGKNFIIDSEVKFKKAIKEVLESLNLAQGEVEELLLYMLVEFDPVQSHPGLQCSQCRKIHHPAEFIKIDSYHGICKRCFQILSSDMSEIFGKKIC